MVEGTAQAQLLTLRPCLSLRLLSTRACLPSLSNAEGLADVIKRSRTFMSSTAKAKTAKLSAFLAGGLAVVTRASSPLADLMDIATSTRFSRSHTYQSERSSTTLPLFPAPRLPRSRARRTTLSGPGPRSASSSARISRPSSLDCMCRLRSLLMTLAVLAHLTLLRTSQPN